VAFGAGYREFISVSIVNAKPVLTSFLSFRENARIGRIPKTMFATRDQRRASTERLDDSFLSLSVVADDQMLHVTSAQSLWSCIPRCGPALTQRDWKARLCDAKSKRYTAVLEPIGQELQ
jgi:hypothetical protein